MKLYDVKIGQRFRFKKDQMIWIKETVQGLDNQMSYCKTEKKFNTRRWGDPKQRSQLFEQNKEIFEIL